MNDQIKVLIVDDDPSWRELLSDLFAELNIAIFSAADASSARQLISEHTFILAVLDLSLSGADHANTEGLDVLALLRAKQPDCQSVMLTGFSTVDIAVSAILKFGAKNFFRKEALDAGELVAFGKRAIELSISAKGFDRKETNDPTESDALNLNNPAVLVIEDDLAWVSFHQEWIADLGLRMDAASTISDALKRVEFGNFLFVVLDLTLEDDFLLEPNLDSPAKALLELFKRKDLPLILITGLVDLGLIDVLYKDQNIFACYNKANINLRELNRTAKLILSDASTLVTTELTNRESDVMALLVEGLTNKVIADKLFITPNTVKRHLKSIFHKLDVNTRSGAVAKFLDKSPH